MTKKHDDTIDLREVAALILAGWKAVALCVVLAVAAATTYALTTPPTYRAEAIFELKYGGSGTQIPPQFVGIASIAGISATKGSNEGIFDRIIGRDFILRLSKDLDLTQDPFFNPTGPVSPYSLTGIKLALGLISTDDLRTDADNSVVATFLRSVQARETKNGSIVISASHADPQRAAIIANGIVNSLVSELAAEDKRDQQERLAYLSDRLADALIEMEQTKKAVADFALANSLASPAAFQTRSELMFGLRERLRRADDMARAVEELTATMTTVAAPGAADYRALRERMPIIDDVDFRRLIGVPEALDAWEWPPRERLDDFASTLADRIARIERSIAELREEAELYASSTEQLAALEREAKVAEATYNVLTEQVKAQSLVTGFEGEIARIYQSATPPQSAAAPRKVFVVITGGMAGLIVGIGSAILLALRSGRLYTETSIAELSGSNLIVRVAPLPRVRSHASLAAKPTAVVERSMTELLVALALSGAKVIIIASTSPRLAALDAALWLAQLRKGGAGPVAVLPIGESALPTGLSQRDDQSTAGVLVQDFGGMDILAPKSGHGPAQLLTGEGIHRLLSRQDDRYATVIVAVDAAQTTPVIRAFLQHDPYIVALARPGLSLSRLIEAIRSVSIPAAVVSLAK